MDTDHPNTLGQRGQSWRALALPVAAASLAVIAVSLAVSAFGAAVGAGLLVIAACGVALVVFPGLTIGRGRRAIEQAIAGAELPSLREVEGRIRRIVRTPATVTIGYDASDPACRDLAVARLDIARWVEIPEGRLESVRTPEGVAALGFAAAVIGSPKGPAVRLSLDGSAGPVWKFGSSFDIDGVLATGSVPGSIEVDEPVSPSELAAVIELGASTSVGAWNRAGRAVRSIVRNQVGVVAEAFAGAVALDERADVPAEDRIAAARAVSPSLVGAAMLAASRNRDGVERLETAETAAREDGERAAVALQDILCSDGPPAGGFARAAAAAAVVLWSCEEARLDATADDLADDVVDAPWLRTRDSDRLVLITAIRSVQDARAATMVLRGADLAAA
ncbi:MAG: hypothetical protein AAFR38_04265 [Planctomycetota bacterium]